MAAEPKSSKAFDQAILRVIRTKKLSVSGETILLAVSGGMDSMVMLDSLHRLSPLLGCELAVAHFNHQLRGSASRRDAELVGKIAKKMGLQFVEGRGDVRRLAKAGKQSVEMAAREMRHGFLIDAAKKLGSHKIALAHHADDQVEQFLLRLFRGAGADGLSGLRWISPSPFDSSFELFRPLLGVSKPAILAQAKRNKISFRKDATNESKKILRNRIRLELLPLIRKSYQTAINSIIRREMEILGDDDALLNEIADDWKAKKTLFSSLPTAIQRRVLMKQFRESGIDPNFEWIERLREGPWRAVVVRDGMSLIVTERGLEIVQKKDSHLRRDFEQQIDLRGKDGEMEALDLRLTWAVKKRPTGIFRARKTQMQSEAFDAAAVGQQVTLRTWREGDRFQPIGMKHSVKLQDFFINNRITRNERHHKLVAISEEGEIFWVEGMRIGDRFKVTSETKYLLNWQWQNR